MVAGVCHATEQSCLLNSASGGTMSDRSMVNSYAYPKP